MELSAGAELDKSPHHNKSTESEHLVAGAASVTATSTTRRCAAPGTGVDRTTLFRKAVISTRRHTSQFYEISQSQDTLIM